MKNSLRSAMASHTTSLVLGAFILFALQSHNSPAANEKQGPAHPESLTAGRLVIKDSKGTERAIFGQIDAADNYGFVVKDDHESVRMSFVQNSARNQASLKLCDSGGSARVLLEVSPDQGESPPVAIGLLDVQGRRRAMLTVDKDGVTSLDILGKDPNSEHVVVRLDENDRPVLAMTRNGKPFAFTIFATAENRMECVLFEDGEKMHRIVRD